MRLLALGGALVLLAAPPCWAGNVLFQQQPIRALGVSSVERLVDGQVAVEGSEWTAPQAALLEPGASIEWNLGEPTPIDGIALQADNDDDYVVSISSDGQVYTPLWHSAPRDGAGLRTRSERGLRATAHFIRLEPAGGDGRFSVSELEIHSEASSFEASKLVRARWIPQTPLEHLWAVGVLAVGVLLFLSAARQPRWVTATLGVGLVATLALLAGKTFVDRSGVTATQLNWMRACVAAIGFLAVLRDQVLPKRRPAPSWFVDGVLAVTAAMGLLCFFNLARPQFFDAAQGRPTFLHHYDMRTYYPIAKYFAELGFDGVYAASAAVVADERGGPANMAEVQMRDLRTHEMTNVAAAAAHVEEVRRRFSPERWTAFQTDMHYFRRAMGDGGFLGSMTDHGGNATPVWFLVANLLFRWTSASDAVLWLSVGADLLLLFIGFAVLGRAFGRRAALVAITVFGAMDFYMFGSNWFGAGLRHDWLALWCLGVGALELGRFKLAGVALMWSALIRAFPLLAFAAIGLGALAKTFGDLRNEGWRFDFGRWRRKYGEVIQLALAAALTGALLVAASSATFGAGAWIQWLHKVSMLNRDNHVNNLSVKTYVTTTNLQWLVVIGGSVAALFFASKRARWSQLAALGVVLLPVVFNPANYYLHMVCVLAVLGAGQGRFAKGGVDTAPLIWLALLAMCFASYFTSHTARLDEHFRWDTVVLLTALAVVWAIHLVSRADEICEQ